MSDVCIYLLVVSQNFNGHSEENAGKGDGKLQGNVRLIGRFCKADKYSMVLRMAREARK